MAEEKFSEKSAASTEPSQAVLQGEQETGILEAVDLATPMDESKTMHDTKKETPSRPRSRVRFQEVEEEEEEQAPVKPPRPLSPQTQAENTLIEAFPSIDIKVVRAVLKASGGQVEPAFNALLGMSDPDFAEEAPPPQPPRPTGDQRQLQQDELYARQLAEHYHARSDHRRGPRQSSGNQPRANPQPNVQNQGGYAQGQDPNEREYSFFDDELPEIRENLRQGFITTQSKVNKWISDFRKRIDGDEDDVTNLPVAGQGPPRQNFGNSQTEQLRGIRKMSAEPSRRSTDVDRYDADPRVLTGDFADLELKDELSPPRKPNRPLANPNLFKPTPPPPQAGPVDEVDALYRTPIGSNNSSGANAASPSPGKSKKWQPLTSVAPAPEAEEEDDPFSLGDDDDEGEAREREQDKMHDVNEEASERLKRAASQQGWVGKGKGRATEVELESNEVSGSQGTRDKTAEEILSG